MISNGTFYGTGCLRKNGAVYFTTLSSNISGYRLNIFNPLGIFQLTKSSWSWAMLSSEWAELCQAELNKDILIYAKMSSTILSLINDSAALIFESLQF